MTDPVPAPPDYADRWGTDRGRQNAAHASVMAATAAPVTCAHLACDDVVANLARAAQVLCDLAAHDTGDRILGDLDALMAVSGDERFVTARHALKSVWKIGLACEVPRRPGRLARVLSRVLGDEERDPHPARHRRGPAAPARRRRGPGGRVDRPRAHRPGDRPRVRRKCARRRPKR